MYLHKRPPIKKLGSWHICQLQLEMFCAGPVCKSALVCLLSAQHGAVLMRVMRDDLYISRMIKLFKVVYKNFMTDEIVFPAKEQGGYGYIPTLPREDYFYSSEVDDETRLLYLTFIQQTKELADNSVLVADLKQSEVQRSTNNNDRLFI